jgi:hypothetical protein
MTVTISGTTGIAGVDGSAGTPAIQGADTNTGMFFPAADTIAFATAGTEDMRIDPSGRVLVGLTSANTSGANFQVSQGVTFPATQSASSDVNTLDDYEEGTWTPIVTSGTGSLTAYNKAGQYTKVGRLVTLNFYFQITTLGTAGGAAIITGLPFSAATSSISAGSASENAVSGVAGVVHSQSTTELFVKAATGGTPFIASAYWMCAISYFS